MDRYNACSRNSGHATRAESRKAAGSCTGLSAEKVLRCPNTKAVTKCPQRTMVSDQAQTGGRRTLSEQIRRRSEEEKLISKRANSTEVNYKKRSILHPSKSTWKRNLRGTGHPSLSSDLGHKQHRLACLHSTATSPKRSRENAEKRSDKEPKDPQASSASKLRLKLS